VMPHGVEWPEKESLPRSGRRWALASASDPLERLAPWQSGPQ
jgi:hypothetical protein